MVSPATFSSVYDPLKEMFSKEMNHLNAANTDLGHCIQLFRTKKYAFDQTAPQAYRDSEEAKCRKSFAISVERLKEVTELKAKIDAGVIAVTKLEILPADKEGLNDLKKMAYRVAALEKAMSKAIPEADHQGGLYILKLRNSYGWSSYLYHGVVSASIPPAILK